MPSRCYTDGDYRFYYDWRLDPYEVADQFHDYIEAVKAVSHCDKVSIIAKCLGTNVVLAYIEKYGTDSIYGLGLDGGTVNGVEPLSEALSGKFKIDGNAITGRLVVCNVFVVTNIDPFLIETMDMVTKKVLPSAQQLRRFTIRCPTNTSRKEKQKEKENTFPRTSRRK